MKSSILLSVILFSFVACKKEPLVAPAPAPLKYADVAALKKDTIPDKAAFKVELVKDHDNYDETMFIFDKTSSLNYNADVDAEYFTGFGQESLSSISTDGTNLAIYRLPYRSGMAIGLDINVQADGAYTLDLSYEKNIPANVHVWLKDNYLKDSVDVCAKKYTFKVVKADPNSYGNQRFQLVISSSN
ncbi:MAG: hypothetical protein ACHQHN_09335 [Sphingobacteriales bacterium]